MAGTNWCSNANAMHLSMKNIHFRMSQGRIYSWERRPLNHRTRENAAQSSPFLLAVREVLVVGLLCFIAFFGSIKYLDILPETPSLLSIPFFLE